MNIFSIQGATMKAKRKGLLLFLMVCVSSLLVCSSCGFIEELFGGGEEALGSIELKVYAEGLDPGDLDESWNLDPIVTVTPAIHEKSVFVGDGAGTISIADVPAGTYTLHALFLDNSLDITVTVSADTETTDTILVPTAGIDFFLINVNSDIPALRDPSVRLALSKAVDREAILTAAGVTRNIARNLIPPQLLNDGIQSVISISESFDDAEDMLSDMAQFDFELSYNDSDTSAAIAAALQGQLESLTAVGTVTLNSQVWGDHLQNINSFNYDLARLGWALDSNNLLSFFDYLIGLTGYDDAGLNNLISQAQANIEDGDVQGYVSTVADIQNQLIDESIVIPVYFTE